MENTKIRIKPALNTHTTKWTYNQCYQHHRYTSSRNEL